MYRQKLKTMKLHTLKHNETYVGESIEQKIERITTNKEPIKDSAPLTYTDRSQGVKPEFDIRTDRWEIAVEAMSLIDKSNKAKREQTIGEKTYDTMTEDQQKEFNTKFPNNKHNKKDGGTPASSTNNPVKE